MIVQITDDLRLNRYDKRNWTLEQYRAPKVLDLKQFAIKHQEKE